MPHIPFFDCNCLIGLQASREPEQIWRTEDILAELEYHHIAGALVAHAQAVQYDPAYGNEQVLAECRKSPRLFPCWVVMPHWAGDFPEPDALVKQMKRRGVRAARVYPKTMNWSLAEYSSRPLLSALEEAGIPLFIPYAETSPGELHALCLRHPRLPVVATGLSWGTPRQMFPVFQDCPNLHIETSAYQGHRGLKVFAEQFGAERILFGSNLPYTSPGACKATVMYSGLTAGEKRLAAGANLARLLGAEPPALRRAARMDPIMSRVDRGLPLRIPVRDAHSHVGFEGQQSIAITALHEQGAAALVESFDEGGIDVSITSSWVGIHGDGAAGNRLVAETIRRFPGRFLGYATINPNYPETIDEELDFCFRKNRFVGVKPYPPRQQYPLDGPNHRKILEFADAHHLLVLYHHAANWKTKLGAAAMIANLSERYLNAKFLFAHSGADWQRCKEYVDVAKRRPNVFLEITYTSATLGAIEYMAREAGAEKVLFGTDAPMRAPCPQMAWVAYARLSVEEKKLILGGNLERLLADVRW